MALALDCVLLSEALAPARVEAFVTHIELALVRDQYQLAEALLARLERLSNLRPASGLDPLDLRRLRLHLEGSVDDLAGFARAILTAGRSDLWAAYLPPILALLRQAGRPDEALELARAWHSASGGSGTAWWAYAQQVLEAHDARLARELLQALPRMPADARQWVILLGLSAVAGDQHQLALLRQLVSDVRAGRIAAVDLDRELAELRERSTWPVDLARALVWLASGQPERALQLAQSCETSPSFVTRLLEHAVAAWAALASSAPARALPHLRAAFDLLSMRRELASELTELVSPPLDLETVGTRLATLLKQHGQLDEAIRVLRRLVELAPERAELRYQLAELFAQVGELAQARQLLESLAQQLQARRDTRARLETLRHLLQLVPENRGVLDELVTGYTRIGLVDQAIAVLEQLAAKHAQSKRTEHAAELLYRAAELATLGQQWRVIPRLYEQLIALDPNDLDRRQAAVTAFVQTGQLGKAIEQLREITRVALARGEPEEALAALHQIVALDARNPDAYHRLAEVLVSLGELEQAERVYRRLLAIAPDDQVARTKQAALSALLRQERSTH
jgi:tetratricopeptide (TPR) repeat protein